MKKINLRPDIKEIIKCFNNHNVLAEDKNGTVCNIAEEIENALLAKSFWERDFLGNIENVHLFSELLFCFFGKKAKAGYKLQFSERNYKLFVSCDFFTSNCFQNRINCIDVAAPVLIGVKYDIDDYFIGNDLTLYKVHCNTNKGAYIKTKYKRFYLSDYL